MTAGRLREYFDRARFRRADRARVRRHALEHWTEVVEELERGSPPLVVVDSLHALASTDADRKAFIRALRPFVQTTSLVLMICHLSRRGGVSGTTFVEYMGDACIIVSRDAFTCEKARWAPNTVVPRT
jgi:predicted ATP-dependent serine protease